MVLDDELRWRTLLKERGDLKAELKELKSKHAEIQRAKEDNRRTRDSLISWSEELEEMKKAIDASQDTLKAEITRLRNAIIKHRAESTSDADLALWSVL